MKSQRKAKAGRGPWGRTLSRHDFNLADPESRFDARRKGAWAAGMWEGDPLRIEDSRERLRVLREQRLPRCPLPGDRVKILGTRIIGTVASFPRVLERDPDTGTLMQEVLVRWDRPKAGMVEYWIACRSLVPLRRRR